METGNTIKETGVFCKKSRISDSAKALVTITIALCYAFFSFACGDDDSTTTPIDGGHMDASMEPITDGDWYQPEVTTTWQWQLMGNINTTYAVDVYDIDLFDSATDTIEALQADGHYVICYFSAGSSEDWRDDFHRFLPDDIGKQLDEWEGENWLDIRSQNVLQIMRDRLDLAVQKGCDGVEPDNMDGFTNDTGFNLLAVDQLYYNRTIANEAHMRNLTVGLKNDGDQVPDLVDYFDFSLNEECHAYDECAQLQPFIDAGKPVFNAEYTDTESEAQNLAATLCPQAQAENIRTLILPWDLDDSFRISCD